MNITDDQLSTIGRLADRIDNLVAADVLQILPQIRLTALEEALPELRDGLRAVYVKISGENPWEDQP